MTLRAQPPRVAAPTPTPETSAAHAAHASHGAPASRSDAIDAGPARGSEPPCPRCREPNPIESRFCHSCGLSLGGAPVAPIQPTPPVPIVSMSPFTPPQRPTEQHVAARPIAPVLAQPAMPPAVAIVCSRCRGVADPGADFCKFCGARLTPSHAGAPGPLDVQPAASRPNPDPPPPAASSAFSSSPPAIPASAPSAPASNGAGSDLATPGPAPSPKPPLGMTRPLHGIGDVQMRGRLVRIAKDGSEGVAHPLVDDQTDIGRAEGNLLLPDDPYLSPRHARIVVRGGARPSLALLDLGSVNGTYVRLRAPHPLTHGDLLLLGQQVLRFEAVSELEGARGPAMQHGVLLFGSPAPAARARLVQRTVEGLVRDVLYVVRDDVTFGREMGDRTFPEDVFMSRRHASIKREGGGYVLHDLGSSNGTFVQIHGEHPLQNADQFRIGHHLFRVDVGGPDAGRAGGNGA